MSLARRSSAGEDSGLVPADVELRPGLGKIVSYHRQGESAVVVALGGAGDRAEDLALDRAHLGAGQGRCAVEMNGHDLLDDVAAHLEPADHFLAQVTALLKAHRDS